MSDHSRYMSQMLIPQVGIEGQQKISAAKILVIGAGGLGCPVLLYLAGMGTGTIGIADDDIISKYNLHRQVLYAESDTGELKALKAKERLHALNSSIHIIVYTVRITAVNAKSVMKDYDIIIDCSDNIDTRYIIDAASKSLGKPFVYGGIMRFEGQVGVFNLKGSVSFTSVFPDKERFAAEQDCAEAGIIGFTAGIIGCLQVNEALKIILDSEGVLADSIITIDLQTLVMKKWKYNLSN